MDVILLALCLQTILIGNTRLGLSVQCHGPPEHNTLCTFALPHASWLGCVLLMSIAILLVGMTICLLVVALHKKRKSFEDAAKWTGLGASKEHGFYTNGLDMGWPHFRGPN